MCLFRKRRAAEQSIEQMDYRDLLKLYNRVRRELRVRESCMSRNSAEQCKYYKAK